MPSRQSTIKQLGKPQINAPRASVVLTLYYATDKSIRDKRSNLNFTIQPDLEDELVCRKHLKNDHATRYLTCPLAPCHLQSTFKYTSWQLYKSTNAVVFAKNHLQKWLSISRHICISRSNAPTLASIAVNEVTAGLSSERKHANADMTITKIWEPHKKQFKDTQLGERSAELEPTNKEHLVLHSNNCSKNMNSNEAFPNARNQTWQTSHQRNVNGSINPIFHLTKEN